MLVIDNGNFERPEDVLKEITSPATPCPVCESTEGYDNLDWESPLVLPPISD